MVKLLSMEEIPMGIRLDAMKATEAKSTHSQQHGAAETSFFSQEQDSAFFKERSPEPRPFFPVAATSSFIQPKYAPGHQPFFQPTAVPFIQAKCTACEAEEREQPKEQSAETLTVQRMPAFESDEAEVQRQPIPGGVPLTVQRMPAFESEVNDKVQSKPLLQRQEETEMEPEEETSTDTELQAKLASNAVEPPEDAGESSEKGLPFTQAKLTIGKAGDRYEQEADAMANQVVAMPKQGLNLTPKLQTKPLRKNISKLVQRQEVFLQPKRLQELPKIQKQGDGSLRASSDVANRLHSNRGSGSSLDEDTRGEMESAFGADFGDVRVHTGSNAAQLSKDLGAKAFTHGSDIYFNQGQYNPNSSEGKHLLAHELTHTVQQGASLQRKVNISTGNAPVVQLILGRLWSAGKRLAIRKFKQGLNYLAERIIPGYTLLNVVLGENLITGARVKRSGVNLIKGYMRLDSVIGSILLSELEQTKSLPAAGKWVEGKVAEFGIDFDDIARRLKLMWAEMSITKGIEGNIGIFKKYLGSVIGKIMAFSSVVMEKVKELRFEAALRLVGATELLEALKKDPKAFKKAVDDPKAVLKKFMVGALKQGFAKFKDNFVTHFKNALFGWLFGKAAEMGVEMPKKFDVAGLFSLIAQLVGATYQQIRAIVVKRLGPKGEMIVSKLEQTVAFIKELVTKGPIALWKRVESFLTNLKEMVFSKIASLVSMEIIKAAVTKLLSMLNPAGALVQLALTLYRVIKFFIDHWETIKSVALGILNSIAMVALNKIGPAAAFVEKVLATGMKLIIAFLARIFGLGGIVDKVKALIKKIAGPVQKAIAKVIDWIVAQGKKLFRKAKKAAKKAKAKLVSWWKTKKKFKVKDGKQHLLFFRGKGAAAKLVVASQEITLDKLLAANGQFESQIMNSEDSAKIGALSTARRDYQNVKSAQAILQRGPNADATRQLNTSFNSLGEQLAIMGVGVVSEANLPETEIAHKPKGVMAGSVTASPLSKKGSGGSKPDLNVVGWDHVTRIDASNWEKTHLVSEDFYGPGRFWNLIPARRTDNAWFRDGPEKVIKTMLAKNTVLHYHVSVNSYYNLTHPVTKQSIEGFPESVSIDLSTLKKEGSSWRRSVNLSKFPTKTFAPPMLTGGQGVDLKMAGRDRLLGLGIKPGVASNVHKVKGPGGSFKDEKDFKERMQVYYEGLRKKEDFKKDHWPKFQELIDGKKAFFVPDPTLPAVEQGVDLKTANEKALKGLTIPRGVASNVGKVKGSGSFKDEKDFKERMQARYQSLTPPHNVDFNKEHWPKFQKLINDKKAFF